MTDIPKKKSGPPKGVQGKRIDFSEADIAQCESYGSVGLNLDQIAALFNISSSALDNVIRRQPEVGCAIKRGKAKGIGNIAKSLYTKAIEGDRTCMIFYLKTQGRWVEATDQGDTIQEEPYSPPESLVDDA